MVARINDQDPIRGQKANQIANKIRYIRYILGITISINTKLVCVKT